MNFLTKIMPGKKKKIVESYLKTLFDISMYTGIHSWDFTGLWPVYKPQPSLVDFFIKSLGKIHSLGLNDKAIAKALNSYNCHNLLCAEIAPWTADDVLLILSASENGLILIN